MAQTRREIVALHYLEPGVAVLWLWLWRGIDVARPGMWLAGLAAVVVANIVICAPDTPQRRPAAPAVRSPLPERR